MQSSSPKRAEVDNAVVADSEPAVPLDGPARRDDAPVAPVGRGAPVNRNVRPVSVPPVRPARRDASRVPRAIHSDPPEPAARPRPADAPPRSLVASLVHILKLASDVEGIAQSDSTPSVATTAPAPAQPVASLAAGAANRSTRAISISDDESLSESEDTRLPLPVLTPGSRRVNFEILMPTNNYLLYTICIHNNRIYWHDLPDDVKRHMHARRHIGNHGLELLNGDGEWEGLGLLDSIAIRRLQIFVHARMINAPLKVLTMADVIDSPSPSPDGSSEEDESSDAGEDDDDHDNSAQELGDDRPVEVMRASEGPSGHPAEVITYYLDETDSETEGIHASGSAPRNVTTPVIDLTLDSSDSDSSVARVKNAPLGLTRPKAKSSSGPDGGDVTHARTTMRKRRASGTEDVEHVPQKARRV